MRIIKKKEKQLNRQCGVCSANFEIWLGNLRASDERKEKINGHFFKYCPACSRNQEK